MEWVVEKVACFLGLWQVPRIKGAELESVYDQETQFVQKGRSLKEYEGRYLVIMNVANNCKLAAAAYREVLQALSDPHWENVYFLMYPSGWQQQADKEHTKILPESFMTSTDSRPPRITFMADVE